MVVKARSNDCHWPMTKPSADDTTREASTCLLGLTRIDTVKVRKPSEASKGRPASKESVYRRLASNVSDSVWKTLMFVRFLMTSA